MINDKTDYRFTEPMSASAFPIAAAGFPYIFAAIFVTVILAILQIKTLALIAIAATGFICYFFRDPDRLIPQGKDVVVSPADGKIIFIGDIVDSTFFDGPCKKVSIFMTVFNVHVNRIPHEGTIKKIKYYPGKFHSANKDKAVTDNEHNAVTIETNGGKQYCMVQIAGLVARRIICRVQAQDAVRRGQKMGMICFGSRVDVYLPVDAKLEVEKGTKLKSGHSVIGYL
jgi:phosphatidylserine decarboxylase